MTSPLGITYVQVDEALKEQIKASWQSNAGDYLHLGSDGLTVAAVVDGQPLGVISAFKRNLPEPLAMVREAFIDIIEVQEPFRRQGIGEMLVSRVVAWAQDNGLDQVRAWSEEIRLEALMLWRKTGFSFAKVDFERAGQRRYGFYAVRPVRKES